MCPTPSLSEALVKDDFCYSSKLYEQSEGEYPQPLWNLS